MRAIIFLHFIILAILFASLVGMAVNLLFFRSLQRTTPDIFGRVSILVPARNEERSIADCVGSLLSQDYPDFEVIVLDDASTDRTAEIVRGLMASEKDAGHKLIPGAALPDGWTGKNWACHQLSDAATGDWLLFTDADTVHTPGAISAAVDMAAETRADLLSAWPRLVTVSLGEKLIIPVLHILAIGWFPTALVRLLQSRPDLADAIPMRMFRQLGGANGQFMFFSRAGYERIGGHAAVRDHIVEDVALGREVARRIPDGMRLVNCDASRLVDCRMYHSFRETWDGFTKNARAAFEDNLASWYFVGGMQFTGFFLPFVLLLFPSQYPLALIEVGLIYLMRAVLTLRMRTSWVGCLLHPAGQFLAMSIAIRSWISTTRSGVQWKGRTYRPTLARRETT